LNEKSPEKFDLVCNMTERLETEVGLTILRLDRAHSKLNKQVPENANSANLLPY